MFKYKLQLEQLDAKMQTFDAIKKIPAPVTGWIRAIRTSLGMSLLQLGNRLHITKQSMREMEVREKEGSITLNSLRQAAAALDMHMVYGFVSKDGSLEELIERKANELATKIVMRTSNSMKLEDQENTKVRLEKAIRERTIEIKHELPKILWD